MCFSRGYFWRLILFFTCAMFSCFFVCVFVCFALWSLLKMSIWKKQLLIPVFAEWYRRPWLNCGPLNLEIGLSGSVCVCSAHPPKLLWNILISQRAAPQLLLRVIDVKFYSSAYHFVSPSAHMAEVHVRFLNAVVSTIAFHASHCHPPAELQVSPSSRAQTGQTIEDKFLLVPPSSGTELGRGHFLYLHCAMSVGQGQLKLP